MEVMLVLAIVGMLSGLVLANYKLGAKQSNLQLAAHLLASNLRRAEQLALAAKQDSDGAVPCGYGVHFDAQNSSYALYASQGTAEADCSLDNKLYDNGEQFEAIISLPAGISFFGSAPPDIFFEPPQASVYFDGERSDLKKIILTDGIQNMTIEVNRFGLVEVRG